MAIGVYLGIRAAYVPELASDAQALHESVDRALSQLRQRSLVDPDPAPALRKASRTTRETHTKEELEELADYAGEDRPHTRLLMINPYRLVYVPREIGRPIALDREEKLGKKTLKIMMGSSGALHRELRSFATEIDVRLNRDGALEDAVASELDAEDGIRAVWLSLFEAARVSTEKDLPICLG